jgi:hypothetical protein
MKKLIGLSRSTFVYTLFSSLLAFLLIFTLLPHEILSDQIHQISQSQLSLINAEEQVNTFTDRIEQEALSYDQSATESVSDDPSEDNTEIKVITEAPTDISANSAVLHGKVELPESSGPILVSFGYGEDASFGLVTETIEMDSPGSFDFRLLNLKPGTIYYFRAKAEYSVLSIFGETCSFVTLEAESGVKAPDPEVVPFESEPTLENAPSPSPNSTNTSFARKTIERLSPDEEKDIQSVNGKLKVHLPRGLVSNDTDIELIERSPFLSTGMKMIRQFELNGSDSNTKEKVSRFNKELQISIQHDPEDLRGVNIDSLRLYFLDEVTNDWVPVLNSQYDQKSQILTSRVDHFTNFGEQAHWRAARAGEWPHILTSSRVLRYTITRSSFLPVQVDFNRSLA